MLTYKAIHGIISYKIKEDNTQTNKKNSQKVLTNRIIHGIISYKVKENNTLKNIHNNY